jgi:amidohydrolase
MTKDKEAIINYLDSIEQALSDIALDIHSHPETPFEEHRSMEILTSFLSQNAFTIEKGLAGLPTSFRATSTNYSGKPTVALLAEYDALPGLGHACGHNLIGPASIGAAVAIHHLDFQMDGQLLVIGAPAEEGGGGKITMIKHGVFDDIDIAMMIHPSNQTRGVTSMLALQEIKFTFHGKSAHAAAFPYEGINALDAVIQTFNNINALRQQLRDDARIHGIISEGGTIPNIIPEKTSAIFYVRALDVPYFEKTMEKVRKCAEGAAISTGCSISEEIKDLVYSPFKPNYSLAKFFKNNLTLLNIEENPIKEKAGKGSSDIGNLSQLLPTIHADIEICDSKSVAHSPEFAEMAKSKKGLGRMIDGAKALAMTVYDLFSSPEHIKMIKKEFNTGSLQ